MAAIDSTGRSLQDYPRPSVAVDAAVLTVRDDRFSVVLVEGGRRLPGTFLHEGETLAQAVTRALEAKAGVRGEFPEQLQVFDDPDRDARGWVLSVAHLVAVPSARLGDLRDGVTVQEVQSLDRLDFDHDLIIDLAVARLRSEYRDRPDPRALLDEPFTLRDLQRLHEVIEGRTFQRDTFRRRMIGHLNETGKKQTGAVGMPARTFTRGGPPRNG